VTHNWLRAAGWWAADYTFAVKRQIRGLFTAVDPQSLHSGRLAPIVVIPGVYESWRFLIPLLKATHARGHPVHVVTGLHLNLRPVIDTATEVSSYIERKDLTGVVILAHSKGGLIGKYVMIQPEGQTRIRGMVAIATPFGGSTYARFMLSPRLRIFSPGDSTIRALASEAEVNARITSIFGSFDPHIPSGSALDGAKNVQLETGGHFRVLTHPQVLEELDELTERRVTP